MPSLCLLVREALALDFKVLTLVDRFGLNPPTEARDEVKQLSDRERRILEEIRERMPHD